MSIAEKLTTVAENVSKVYEAGKKSEYDKFWDVLQDYGNRRYYSNAFTSIVSTANFWNEENFNPKYDIILSESANASDNMFLYTPIKDLEAILLKNGVKFDTSQTTRLNGCFDRSRVEKVPSLDASNCTTIIRVFYDANKLIKAGFLNITEGCTFNNVFVSCVNLANLEITGTIGQNGFNVKDCTKLTVASLLSILTALSKDSSIASGKSVTFADNHLSVIQADEGCLAQLSSAAGAGWSIFFGTTKYEG